MNATVHPWFINPLLFIIPTEGRGFINEGSGLLLLEGIRFPKTSRSISRGCRDSGFLLGLGSAIPEGLASDT